MKNKNWMNVLKKAGWLIIPFFLSSCEKMGVLNSHGPVGQEESFLIKLSLALMLIVVLPVFVLVFWIVIRYRASNKKATYKPKWGHSNIVEGFVWGIPILIIIVLAYLTWVKTIELDPYKPLESEHEAIQVEVISTDWNWLFIYPDYNIAVMNELVFPENRPVSFRLTSASVMTSFFIPQLGSQIYAMAGMQTKLNLMANQVYEYEGQNQEYSGNGYAKMRFKAISTTQEDFEKWVEKAKHSPNKLTEEAFEELRKPTVDYPVTLYSSVVPNLFDNLMGEFMDWMNDSEMHRMHQKKGAMPEHNHQHQDESHENHEHHEHMMEHHSHESTTDKHNMEEK